MLSIRELVKQKDMKTLKGQIDANMLLSLGENVRLAAHLNIMLLQPSVLGKTDKTSCLCLRHKCARETFLAIFFSVGTFSATV